MKVQHPIVPLEQVVSLVKRGETPKEGVIYRQIGVRLWGKGSYERASMDGGDTKYKTLYKVNAADLIVNKIWARNGSVAVITAEVDGCFVSAEFPTFELNKKKILPRWLHWITKTPILWDQFDVKSHGTSGKNRIQPNKILSAKIPLPDIEKQKYLLDLIEDIAIKHEKITNLHEISLGDVQRLRQAILQEAVQGKLIPQDPNDEPASELLKRIKAEKEKLIADGKIKKQKPLLPITEDEIPYELPQGWEWVRLGNISNRIGSGSTPRGGKSVYTESGIPFLRSQNVWEHGLELSDVAYIPEEIHQKMSNTMVQPNDVLLNITGASLGRCAIYPDGLGEANVSQHVTIIRPTDALTSFYLHLCLLSPYIQELVWGRQVGMAREGLSKKVLELFEIPLPPLAEQKRIVAKVDQLMHLCDELESRLNQSKKDSEMLMQAVLHEAFS